MAEATFERNVTIGASAADVWNVLTDLDQADVYMKGLVAAVPLTEGGFQKGFRWKETRRFFLLFKFSSDIEITDFAEGRSYTARAEDAKFWATFTFTVDGHGDHCHASMMANVGGKGAKDTQKFADTMARNMARMDGPMLEKVKAHLEARHGAKPVSGH